MSSTFTEAQMRSSLMKHWQYITTVGGHAQMTPMFIRDIGAIINTLVTTGRVSQLKTLIDMLYSHVENREEAPHGFGIDYFKNELIAQLFKGYRLLGYTGDLTDMWTRLFTTIEVATLADAVHKHEDTKAVTAPKFKVMFDMHERSLNSHLGTLAEFMPKGVYNKPPSISLRDDYMSDPYYDDIKQADGSYLYVLEDGQSADSLGTLVLEFTYTSVDTAAELIALTTVHLSPIKELVLGIEAGSLVGYVNLDGIESAEPIFTYPLEVTDAGSRKFLISYNPGDAVLRGSNLPIAYIPSFTADAGDVISSIHIHRFTKDDPIAWVRGLSYYPDFIEAEDALVFLVD